MSNGLQEKMRLHTLRDTHSGEDSGCGRHWQIEAHVLRGREGKWIQVGAGMNEVGQISCIRWIGYTYI